jgi:FixJ family two-component response regulator
MGMILSIPIPSMLHLRCLVHVLAGVRIVSTTLERQISNLHGQRERSMPESQPVIAIVDDDVSMLRALRRLLTSARLASETYTSAEEFLRSGLQPDVGCLVLDIQMPGMTGLDLLVHLATSGVTLPVIIMTARVDEQTRHHAEQAGVVAYLCKPFEEDALLEAIRRALASYSGHQS